MDREKLHSQGTHIGHVGESGALSVHSTGLLEPRKSLERSATVSLQRSSQVVTPSLNGKSPLLLQKKQQMVIQKTKEPSQVQTQINPSQVEVNKKQVQAQNGQRTATKSSAKLQHYKGSQDLLKRYLHQRGAIDPTSPYVQLGAQQVEQKRSSKDQAKNIVSQKRNTTTTSTSVAIDSTLVNIHKTEYITAIKNNRDRKGPKGQPTGKASISQMVESEARVFSEREMNAASRIKLSN